MYNRPKIDKAFFARRSKLLSRFRDKRITEAELMELKQCADLLNEYIFEIKMNRKIAKGGKITVGDD